MFHSKDGAAAERDRIVRTRPDGSVASWRPYLGRAAGSATQSELEAIEHDASRNAIPEPQVYLVEQPADKVFQQHFHFVDQFQLVTAGEGHIGRHAVKPFSVHFAAAFTGYGPITPGPEGIHYLTLRACTELTGAHLLPESKGKMRPGLRRKVIVDDIDAAALGEKTRATATVREIYAAEPDGLAIVLLRIASHQSETTALPTPGNGQNIVVLAGSIRCREAAYGPLSVICTSADEAPLSLTTDEGGADVLLLQYPQAPQP